MQLFRLNMNLGKHRKTAHPSLMLSCPRPGTADFIFHLAQKEAGPAPAGSVKEPAECHVCRAHFCAGLNDPGPVVKRLSFIRYQRP